MLEQRRRRELGAFLQTHRKKLEPVQAGLEPPRTRRMKGGLRREELAALAGVSVTWYTRLEQGFYPSAGRAASNKAKHPATCRRAGITNDCLYAATGRKYRP